MSNFDIYDEFLNFGNKLLEKPYILLDHSSELYSEANTNIKKIHDILADFHNKQCMQRTTIPGIITNKMDQDQIWAQLNKASISLQKSFKSGFKILNLKEKVNKIELEKEETPNYEEKPEKQSSFLDEEMNEEINIDNNENIEEESQNSMKNEHEPDDKVDFNDLEHFLEEAETKDYKEIHDELYGEGVSEENEISVSNEEKQENDIHYKDFYQENDNENPQDNEINEDNDDEIENGVFEEIRDLELEKKDPKSKINDEIDRLEDKILNAKTWQLKGEIRSAQRPKNSLLEENLDFKSGVKLLENPLSKEFSESLEKTIKQRVLDEAWDDVAEYNLAKPMQENFGNEEQLNFGKSKKGLADIYEDKYKKNILNLPVETEGDKAKIEIQELFKKLCYNLDHLSNLNFVPKPEALALAKISLKNVASIKREEKIPIFISESMQKGPNELFDRKKKAVFEEKIEMASDVKKAMHRRVKRNIRNRNKEKVRKGLVTELSVKGQTKFEYNQMKKSQAKIKKETEQKKVQSIKFTKSAQFFQNLQASNTSLSLKGQKEKIKDGKNKRSEGGEVNRKNFKL